MRTRGVLSSSGATDGGERAVSPVVGIALLVGVTVMLALVVAPFVFGVSGNLGSEAPSAEFAFVYEGGESLDLGTPTDDFGTPVGQGDGIVTIQFERGDSMDPANLEVRGSVSGGNLLDDTGNDIFGPDDSVREGGVISVTAARGETVQVIWTGPGGEESAVLGDFSIEVPESLTPPWVPEADVGCGYIEDQLTDTENDISVVGVVVECDLDQYYPRIDDIEIASTGGNLGAVVGNVNGTGDIDILQGAGVYQGYLHPGADGDDGELNVLGGSTVYAEVNGKGDGDATIGEASEVNGDLRFNSTVKVEEGSSVSGRVVAGTGGDDGDIDILNATVGGRIVAAADSDIIVGDDSDVGGDIDGYGTVKVEEGSSVGGKIVAGTGGDDGTVDVLNGTVDGRITSQAEGDVTVDVGTVRGGIDAGDSSDVTIEQGTVQGRINGTGEITVKEMSTVAGSLLTSVDGGSGGDVTVTTATILGDIRTTGDSEITIENTSDVTGDVNSSAELTVKERSTVDGRATSNSTLTLDVATIGGNAVPRGSASLDCISSTINGQSCSAYKQPRLAVNITDTNSPVTQGDDATINVRAENNGFGGATDVRLLVDGSLEKSMEFDVERNKQTNNSFDWDTTGASTGEHNVTVASDVDSNTTTVYVSSPGSAAFEISSLSSNSTVLAGNPLNVTAEIRNTGDTNGTTTVELRDFDGNTVDSTTTSIEDGESKTVTLSWSTTDSDTGTGDVTVDVGTDTASKSIEVKESYYNLQDVTVTRSGQDLDVEVFLNTSNDATMEIEFVDSGTQLDSRTESAVSDVYTILRDDKAKNTNGDVIVTLYDGNGNQQDSMSRSWSGKQSILKENR
jgi:hypothetical protein